MKKFNKLMKWIDNHPFISVLIFLVLIALVQTMDFADTVK